MRILTWNINGIRTIPQYHPWNTLKTHDAILNHLQADIINFQEVKSTRSSLPATVALPPSYDAYYSFPLSKNGYSGVATYTRRPSADSPGVTAMKAEEGLTGQLRQPHLKPPLSNEERVSRPEAYEYDDFDAADSVDLKALDAEGRVLTVDFGLFVLINVYCPNDGSTEDDNSRFEYKMAFHKLLEARVRSLIREGRQVVLLGDINACAGVIDHCEGDIIIRRGVAQGFDSNSEEYFWFENPARQWLRALIEGEKKCLVDIVRQYHPDRQGMFTCWNTKISARASNYGTRIDYVLVTPGLLPWIKAADIDPSIKGSDHCPVWIELHEEIEVSTPHDGVKTVKLRDLLMNHSTGESNGKERDPPRLATRFWDEYSGKQRLLASFFNPGGAKPKAKRSVPDTASGIASSSLEPAPSSISNGSDAILSTALDIGTSNPTPSSQLPLSQLSLPSSSLLAPTASSSSISSKKRKASPPSSSPGSTSASQATTAPSSQATQSQSKKQKTNKQVKEIKKSGQSKLSSFFVTPSTSGAKTKQNGQAKAYATSTASRSKSRSTNGSSVDLTASDDDAGSVGEDLNVEENGEDEDDDENLKRAIQLSLAHESPSDIATTSNTSQEAWKSLLKPPDPPRCTVHNEVAKEFRVNKPGVNKGRSFWVCSRPVGPGYDKGRSERPREEVDDRWKCNFFIWSSELGTKRNASSRAGK
ncbi:hypothetical protein GYMLUDRAFT_237226 [Collybiopsis luxurians FD-317 M1]|nr:hypothetical protein GYMLUDRAFT_237226 [Collybiopsis luxurians FD-317 M1]